MTDEPELDDDQADDSIESAAVQEAERDVLVRAANDAIEASNTACVLADASFVNLRDIQFTAAASMTDATVWSAIVSALEALPHDATDQQIALAQAKAIVNAKTAIARSMHERMPAAQSELVRDVLDAQKKQRAAEKAKGALQPAWYGSLLGMAAVTMGSFWLMGLKAKAGS